MASKCAAYGRFITRPYVAAAVLVAVIATNLGVIIGSKMWETTLVSQVDQLWINPASSVAANNKIINAYSQPSIDTFPELWMLLGTSPGQNIVTPELIETWYTLSKSVMEIAVTVNGTTYTTYDVCAGRLAQSPYTFGCNWINSIDFFQEAGFQNPTDAAAQWMLDEKLAHRNNFYEWQWAVLR